MQALAHVRKAQAITRMQPRAAQRGTNELGRGFGVDVAQREEVLLVDRGEEEDGALRVLVVHGLVSYVVGGVLGRELPRLRGGEGNILETA